MIFTPGDMILISSCFFSVGAAVTSQARTFAVFIVGRVLVGVGGGGILMLAMILVIQLTSKSRRQSQRSRPSVINPTNLLQRRRRLIRRRSLRIQRGPAHHPASYPPQPRDSPILYLAAVPHVGPLDSMKRNRHKLGRERAIGSS